MHLAVTSRSARPPIATAFSILVLLAFSDEIAYAASRASWIRDRIDWLYPTLDVALLVLLAWLRRRVRLAMERPRDRSVTLYWFVGALLMLAADVWWVRPHSWLELPQPWEGLILAIVFAAATALLVAATVGVSPRMFVSRRMRSDTQGWNALRATIPLTTGILFAFLASVWWDTGLEPSAAWTVTEAPPVPVNVQFFAQASQVLPLFIVALGYEIRAFDDAMDDTQRGGALVSLAFLCAGEVLALSVLALPENNSERQRYEFEWHLYGAFLVVVAATIVGLTTIVGALIAESRAKWEAAQKENAPVTQNVIHKTQFSGQLHAVAVGIISLAVTIAAFRKR